MLADPEDGDPEVILIATGSEVSLAVEAHEELIADGVRSRVVSLPCWEMFDRQDEDYRDERAARRDHGARLGRGGLYPGLGPLRRREWSERSGCTHSAARPRSRTCMSKFGFTPDKVAEAAKEVCEVS